MIRNLQNLFIYLGNYSCSSFFLILKIYEYYTIYTLCHIIIYIYINPQKPPTLADFSVYSWPLWRIWIVYSWIPKRTQCVLISAL